MMLYPRDILSEIQKVIERPEFIILTGARQTGKSSLLFILKKNLEEKGQFCRYFNLENPDYLKLLNKHPFKIFGLIPASAVKQNVFIDEIQYLDNPSNFLKLLYDEKKEKIKIIASGSSAFYIDRKFKESLAGRKFLFDIYPLNFNEFLVFNQAEDLLKLRKKRMTLYQREKLLGLWEKYIIYGGYPKVVLEQDEEMKRVLLEEIGTSYIKKDIAGAGIKNSDKYFALLKILAQQSGNLVNSQELANTLSLAHKTIEEYLYVMKKSYQIAFLRPFSENLRKELTKMPKVYFYDLGLKNFFLQDYNSIDKRSDRGAYAENIAFREFLRMAKSADKIKFWRTQDRKEVDFVVAGNAFEIKFSKERIKTKPYIQFRETYPKISFSFLNYEKFLERFYHFRIEL